MKTINKLIFLFILPILVFSFAPAPPPTLINNGDKITVGTTEVEYQLNDDQIYERHSQLLYIKVDDGNTGTIQFSVGVAVGANHHPWPAGSKFPITVRNGIKNLRAKGSAASQVFTITY